MTMIMHPLHELAPQSDGKRSWGAYQIVPRSHAGRMSIRMTALLAGILVIFAVVHVVGGTLLPARSYPPAQTQALIWAD